MNVSSCTWCLNHNLRRFGRIIPLPPFRLYLSSQPPLRLPRSEQDEPAVAALRGFPTSVVPATIILDKQHRVAAVYLAEITDDELSETVDRILAEEVEQV